MMYEFLRGHEPHLTNHPPKCLFFQIQLIISIDRHEDFERAMRQATMNAEWNFDPIRFWVCNAQELVFVFCFKMIFLTAYSLPGCTYSP
jgi:hypothetical protein